MSGVVGVARGLVSLASLRQAIRHMPIAIAQDAATDAASYLTRVTREDFASGRTVYGDARPTGAAGQKLSLVSGGPVPRYRRKKRKRNPNPRPRMIGPKEATKHVRDTIGFSCTGTIVRARLTQRYAKYLVGKYEILPQSLPVEWRDGLREICGKHFSRLQSAGGMRAGVSR